MSSQPENNFIKSIHRLLPATLYREKMHNMYRGGTPDVWYSGEQDLWVEYKNIKALPARRVINPCDSNEFLSVLQQNWLRERHGEGRRVAVIIGCPGGGVILPGLKWETPLPAHEFIQQIQDKKTIAGWIVSHTTGEKHVHSIQQTDLCRSRKTSTRDRRTSDVCQLDG